MADAAAPPPTAALIGERRSLARRRVLMALLVTMTTVSLSGWLLRLLLADGLDAADLVLLALLTLTLPWIAVGAWNAVIGLAIGLRRDPAGTVFPAAAKRFRAEAAPTRTAVLVPIHDEDPEPLFRHLRATMASLDATGHSAAFTLHILSDTTDPATAAEEERRARAWRSDEPDRVHYRRRRCNVGHKTGNLWEWLERCGAGYELMVVLDADSLMSGDAMLRLVRAAEADPGIGIVQHLIVGLPNPQPFPRLFQLGMRHGMRAYALGATWWQGDCGPYWGHNAVVRIAPFMAHCRMPELPGRPPFGGRIVSHDQVEAVLMRRAGWQVRLLVEEEGSFEVNPPTLIEFIQRDLRWGKGNLQYANLLPRLDAHAMGRLQLALAILMYVNAPAWLGFVVLAFGRAVLAGAGMPLADDPAVPLPLGAPAAAEPWLLLAAVAGLTFAPKLAGVAQACLRPGMAGGYGGRPRLLGSALIELLFSIVLTPLMMTSQARVAVAMLGGRAIHWGAQLRSHRSVRWAEALRSFWFEIAFAAALVAATWRWATPLLPWALLLGGLLLLAPVLAVVTASPGLGRRMVAAGLAATPDEIRPSEVVIAAGHAIAEPALASRTAATALAEA